MIIIVIRAKDDCIKNLKLGLEVTVSIRWVTLSVAMENYRRVDEDG